MKRSTPSGAAQAEFHRPFDTSEMSDEPVEREISADEAERAALARRFGLRALDRLSARLTVRRIRDDLFHVSGRFQAAVVQQCVVTLEPVRTSLDEPLAMTFAKGKALASGQAVDGLEDEEPDSMDGDVIDLGEAVAQQLAVSLDPYPRAPGASLEAVLPAGKEEGGRASPFAALEA